MRVRAVCIEWMDGKTERIQFVDVSTIHDGVLHLWRDRSFSGGREHLGSFPLANIRKWNTEE